MSRAGTALVIALVAPVGLGAGCNFDVSGIDLGPGTAPADLGPAPAIDLGPPAAVDAATPPDLATGCPGGAPPHVGEITESNATSWSATPAGSTVSDDSSTAVIGGGSIRLGCNAAKCSLTYPEGKDAAWDLDGKTVLRLWVSADDSAPANDPGWSESDPHVRLATDDSNYFEYVPVLNKLPRTPPTWISLSIPLDGGGATWIRTSVGSPSLSMVNYVALSMSTFGSGFRVWVDGLTFEPAPFYNCAR